MLLAAWRGWEAWRLRPLYPPPGMLAPEEPQQTPLEQAAAIEVDGGRYSLQPLAQFSLHARVLAHSDYHLDTMSGLIPTDIAFGWGRMSDSAVLATIDISQDHRFYFWSVRDFPIPRAEIETHSANMHLIPANDAVRHNLRRLRVGQGVWLDGELVEVHARDGWSIRSSLSRDDTGPGACEVVWVEHLSLS